MEEPTDTVTPELALVDPELAAAARVRLPAPGDCLAPRRRPVVCASTPGAAATLDHSPRPADAPRGARRRRSRERLVISLTWLVVAAILGTSLLAFIPPRGASRPQLLPPDDPEVTTSSGSESTPGATVDGQGTRSAGSVGRVRARTTKDGGLELRWRPDARAVFYNVVVFRDGKRIDLWPTRASVSLAAPASSPAARRAARIRYSFFVYPAYRSGAAIEFGRELARGAGVAGSAP